MRLLMFDDYVCGETRGMIWHTESWWWNEEIAALVKEKRHSFELWKGPKKCRKGCRCEKTDRRKLCRRGKLGVKRHGPFRV